jgi:long-chain acyl-CoA synthetase
MNIAQSVERGRCLSADRPALIFEGEALTYRELDETASRIANGLLGLGVRRGDRVALFLPNIPSWAFFYLGIQKIGAIAVSLNSTLTREEVGFILNDCGAMAAVMTEDLRRNVPVKELPLLEHRLLAEGRAIDGEVSFDELIDGVGCRTDAVEMEADAPAAIAYTSGTTGTPKGVVLSHGNVISNIEAKRHCLGIRPDDRLLLFLPLSHCFGQNAVFNSGLGAGATVVLHRKFEVSRVLRSIADQHITMVFGVPATFIVLHECASTNDMSSVRYYFSAAQNLPAEIESRWQKKFGLPLHQGYGLTETSPFASYNHQHKHKPGSIGIPIEKVEMKIVDVDDGSEVPPETPGEIVIRGPNVMLGYWNRPADTAQVIKGGWFHTGDIGRMDVEGYFYIEDRLKDMINVGGLKVYPAEVENVIYRHPAVAEVAVYGLPEPMLGERVAASVVLKSDHAIAAEEVLALCRRHLSGFKVPSSIWFVASLPKNSTGKILKRVLREEKSGAPRESGQPGAAAGAVSRQTVASIQSWLTEWLAGALKVESREIDICRSFFDYDLDSLGLVKLNQDLSCWLGCSLDITIAWNFPTIESLAHHLTNNLADAKPLHSVAAEPWRQSHDRHEPTAPRQNLMAATQSLTALSDDEMAELLQAELSAARQRKAT